MLFQNYEITESYGHDGKSCCNFCFDSDLEVRYLFQISPEVETLGSRLPRLVRRVVRSMGISKHEHGNLHEGLFTGMPEREHKAVRKSVGLHITQHEGRFSRDEPIQAD